MKTIQYIQHFNDLKPNVKEAFGKGCRFGLYLGFVVTIILFSIFKYIL